MSNNGMLHKLIERPRGISGYSPKQWCSVCGKAVRGEDAVNCTDTDCPNICHINCLSSKENLNFDCFDVVELRSIKQIPNPVTYLKQQVTGIQDQGPQQQEVTEEGPDERDTLLQYSKEELVEEVVKQKKEVKEARSLISELKNICSTIASKRDALVEALNFVDTLTATVSSIQEKSTKSIACSAIPHRIDQDWEEIIQNNTQVQSWWEKRKPNQQRKQNQQSDTTLENTNTSTVQAGTQSSEPPAAPTPSAALKSPAAPKTPAAYSNTTGYIKQTNQAKSQKKKPTVCNICHKRGHRGENCRSRLRCEYCKKTGHLQDDCLTRVSDEKQKLMFSSLINEQANQTAALIRTLQAGPLLSPAQPYQAPRSDQVWYRPAPPSIHQNVNYQQYHHQYPNYQQYSHAAV